MHRGLRKNGPRYCTYNFKNLRILHTFACMQELVHPYAGYHYLASDASVRRQTTSVLNHVAGLSQWGSRFGRLQPFCCSLTGPSNRSFKIRLDILASKSV